jgi:anaerobic magnesium-protoporphyrin IX monomethyl ester cyclase
MKREKLDMEWSCEGRVDRSDFEMFREMARAGCNVMYFGIESGNQRILDYYQKRITPAQSEKAVAMARKAGVDIVIGSFIVGAPNETRAEIRNTIEFAKRISIDLPQINILGVYPGMTIWDELAGKGYFDPEEYWETGVLVSKVCPTAVPYDEIKRMTHRGFYDFVRRPKFLLRQAARTVGSSYRRKVILSNLSRLSAIKDSVDSVA